eukprot:9984623-Alexandrium_andersonii.AAC.1
MLPCCEALSCPSYAPSVCHLHFTPAATSNFAHARCHPRVTPGVTGPLHARCLRSGCSFPICTPAVTGAFV